MTYQAAVGDGGSDHQERGDRSQLEKIWANLKSLGHSFGNLCWISQ